MRLGAFLATVALAAGLVSCSSDEPVKPKPSVHVKPISKADLANVVAVLCQEPTAGMVHVLDKVQDASVARMRLLVNAIGETCPDRLQDLSQYNNARLH